MAIPSHALALFMFGEPMLNIIIVYVVEHHLSICCPLVVMHGTIGEHSVKNPSVDQSNPHS